MIDGVIREELGKSARELFATFSEAPIAAASLAQVHTATLKDGREVIEFTDETWEYADRIRGYERRSDAVWNPGPSA